MCKSVGPDSGYRAGNRGWQWIKLKRDYRSELSDTVDLVVVGAFSGRGRRRGLYGAVLLAAYDPDADLFRTVGKCGTGFSDADLAELPTRLAPYQRDEKPALVDARQPADVWFEPGLVLEVLSAELTLSPNAHRRLGPAQGRARGWRCGSRGSPAGGGTTRARRTRRPRPSWSTSTGRRGT